MRRRVWLGATVVLTVGPLLAAIVLAPDGDARPVQALVWLLFVGSSLHVGATGWFFTVPQVRTHMSAHPARYLWTPPGLVAGWAALAVASSDRQLAWLLLGFFAWQFHHFQKQNLGVAALASAGFGARAMSVTERRALVASGVGGIAALLGHPQLLQLGGVHRQDWLFASGAAVFVGAFVVGMVCLVRRPVADRPIQYAGVYLISLLFFAPVLCFESPYAAVAGLTVAHGLQYLLLVAFVAANPSAGAPASVGLLVLLNVALALAVLVNWSSHQHGGGWAEHAVFGVYLGLVSAHFVIDAGLWRLRDEFPRTFLAERLPFLVRPRPDAGLERV